MWTETDKQIARDGYGKRSASVIGAEIGKSRCAVIGWWYRNDRCARFGRSFVPLENNRELALKPKIKRSYKVVRKPAADIPSYVPPINDADIPFGQRKTLLELTNNTCRWPIGEVGDGLFFCGAQIEEGCPYCPGHAARAYT